MRWSPAAALLLCLVPVAEACQPTDDFWGYAVQVHEDGRLVFSHATALRGGGDTCAAREGVPAFDGRFVAWRERGLMQVWDSATGRQVPVPGGVFGRGVVVELGQALAVHGLAAGTVQAVPAPEGTNWAGGGDGYAWALSADGGVWIYDAVAQRLLANGLPPPPAPGNGTVHAADGAHLLAGDVRHAVWILDLASGAWTRHDPPRPDPSAQPWEPAGFEAGRPVFARGARTGTGLVGDTVARLDLATGTWAYGGPAAAAVGGKVARLVPMDLPSASPAWLAWALVAVAVVAIGRRGLAAGEGR